MPVALVRLRIAGFKSFAEPAVIEILPGLTGIVGPNGCGKSNVVEALRWAMGESSARTLRGGEMDDVIFAGTSHRPSRNLAEVTLSLEDAAGLAPPPYHEQADLQISRSIERGVGSVFRINGREMRARDVQTLFADLASGARSSGLVSQGRVASIVNAGPDERRAVLEEAAGITGLHARPHEAEIKLRGAEANLERSEDLRGQLETQLAALQLRARQANRHRNLSGAVRSAEAELLAVQRAQAAAPRAAATEALHDARVAVSAATAEATATTARATAAQAAVPPLRNAESEARTALERHRLAREQVEAEAGRARDAVTAADRRRKQVARDLGHAEQASQAATAADARLALEAETLIAAEANDPDRLHAAQEAEVSAIEAAGLAEAAANAATEHAAELTAIGQALVQRLTQAESRAGRLAQQLRQLQRERERAAHAVIDPARLRSAAIEQVDAAAALAESRTALERAEQARLGAQATLAGAREQDGRHRAAQAKLAAETQALGEILAVRDGERWPPVVDSLDVPAGLETALGAALGEELAAAANPDAPRHWRDLPALTPAALPAGCTALASLIQVPPALVRILSGIGLVDGAADGDVAQPALQPGQLLVSRDGGVWRWDGYTIRPGTPSAAAVRLTQRNRLRKLHAQLAAAAAEADAAHAIWTAADAADRRTLAGEQAARSVQRDAEQRHERARNEAIRLAAQAGAASARITALDQQIERLAPEIAEAAAFLTAAEAERAALPDLTVLRQAVESARIALAAARQREVAIRSEAQGLVRDAAARAARQHAIAAERADWAIRAADAVGRLTDLKARTRDAKAEHAALQTAPADLAARANAAAEALATAEATHRRATRTLDEAVATATGADQGARACNQALSTAREQCVRAEAAHVQAEHAWGTVAERILDRLGADPVLPAVDLASDSEDRARRRLERLQREREDIGPVNLRAEIETGEIQARIDAILREREELGTAIAKLRGSIGHQNREGRERLTTVFTQVDRHFQALFTRMFGGGRGHLALVGSDDPLQAGLEIYAQPPGKKLATLSLLSGGEQALTALSLIFAVFRCNPAPVCVLDEVDAPLDDANVERFCTLLTDMVAGTGTRFLVVTHHPLTMARMDRLYGVTMQERGVSRLLSVDLQRGVAMVERSVAAD